MARNHKKTCCYGEYQKKGYTTGDFLNNLSLLCRQDARERWNFEMEGIDFDTMNYELEVLQDEKKLAHQLNLNKNNPFGIYLTFNQGSATYLPGIWKESIPEAKTITDLLDYLAGKARGTGGRNRSWKNDSQATIRLYKSKKYYSKSSKKDKSKKKKRP